MSSRAPPAPWAVAGPRSLRIPKTDGLPLALRQQLEPEAYPRPKFGDVHTLVRGPCVTDIGKDSPVLAETPVEAATDMTLNGAPVAVKQPAATGEQVGGDGRATIIERDRIAQEHVADDLSDRRIV